MPWYVWVIIGVIALFVWAILKASGLREEASRRAFEEYRRERGNDGTKPG